ncbi:hypothetical protein LC612_37485 [Nostoc sp. CHAB 5834]|nr:hypothetical protein [Nostoc sp. CHAB 5834]
MTTTLLAISLPCILFVWSWLKVDKAVKRFKADRLGSVLFLVTCIFINVVSTVWCAATLSKMDTGFQIPEQLKNVSLSGGLYVFIIFSTVLGIQDLVSLIQKPSRKKSNA